MSTDNTIKFYLFLAPVAFVYGLGVRFRNLLFKWGFLPKEHYSIPLICIGNLSVGGTGKTPHTEYLIQRLKGEHRLAVLSRGYKRQTEGFVLATTHSTSLLIGDEPYQMKQKFPDILVAVDADRRRGIARLLALPEGERPEVILLDDAFQHRYVTPSLAIVLTDYHRLYYKDKLLPYGRLREPISGISRADVVIVTKCPEDMKPIDCRIVANEMSLFAHQKLYFSYLTYGELRPVFPEKANGCVEIKQQDDVLLLAGIASPGLFVDEVKKLSDNVACLLFSDHHDFRKPDFKKMKEAYDQLRSAKKYIITTEKDAARLKQSLLLPEEWKANLYYLPITIAFRSGNEHTWEELVKKHIYILEKNRLDR